MKGLNLYAQIEDLEIEYRVVADFFEKDQIPERQSPGSLTDEYIIIRGKDIRLVDALKDEIITEEYFLDTLKRRGITLKKSILKEAIISILQ